MNEQLARFNSGVARARAEYRREPIHFAVDALCETCQTNKRDRRERKCTECKRNKDAHRANWHSDNPKPWGSVSGHRSSRGAA